MELVVVERSFTEPVHAEDVQAGVEQTPPCYAIRRAEHVLTALSTDGLRAICIFRAPDAASVRAANDENGDAYDRIWTATVIERTPRSTGA